MDKKSVMFVFGTRPEVIKMAPVIKAFEEEGTFGVSLCVIERFRRGFCGNVGQDCDDALVIREANQILKNGVRRRADSFNHIFGDGLTSQRIVRITRRYLEAQQPNGHAHPHMTGASSGMIGAACAK